MHACACVHVCTRARIRDAYAYAQYADVCMHARSSEIVHLLDRRHERRPPRAWCEDGMRVEPISRLELRLELLLAPAAAHRAEGRLVLTHALQEALVLLLLQDERRRLAHLSRVARPVALGAHRLRNLGRQQRRREQGRSL